MWCLNQSKTKNNALKSFLDFINLKENVFKLKKNLKCANALWNAYKRMHIMIFIARWTICVYFKEYNTQINAHDFNKYYNELLNFSKI